MASNSEANILVVFLSLAYLMMLAAMIPLLITITLGAIHWYRRTARERVEGTHTAAAHGSRAGEKLGAIIAVLTSATTQLVLTGLRWDMFSLLTLIFIVAPAGLWGMVSGSIAGHRSTRTAAVSVGAFLFFLRGDPTVLFLTFTGSPGHVDDALGFWLVTLLHLLLGAVVGNAAFRPGTQRAAALAGGGAPRQNILASISSPPADATTPTTQWQHLA